jgi:hypothetical protein
VSGCTAHCQGVSQIQVSVQESVTVQATGAAVQSASGLNTQRSPSSASQVASAITEFQIGCITECFGTTTTSATTAALTQQLLSNFNLLQPACGSSGTEATPATIESVVDQVACQLQSAQTAATQTQIASQSATAVQATDAPLPGAQVQQGTLQLQIGCVFYCADTQQVQQAQQSVTIINVQAGPSTSDPGTIDVSAQIIWQLQIGCVAWCYDATQLQVAGQSTAIVNESPVPPSPPPPTPAPAAPTPTPDPAGPAQQPGPVGGQPTATTSASRPVGGAPLRTIPPVRRVRLFRAVGLVGESVSAWIAPAVTVARVRQAIAAAPPAIVAPPLAIVSSTPAVAVDLSVPGAAHPQARRALHLAAGPHADHPVRVAEALVPDPTAPNEVPVIPLLIATAAALLALAAIWTQVQAKSGR